MRRDTPNKFAAKACAATFAAILATMALACTHAPRSIYDHPSMDWGHNGSTRPLQVDWDSISLTGVLIRQKRGPCFGPCPIYSVSVWGDGRVQYVGFRNVRVCGERTRKISEVRVQHILELARLSEFFSIDVEREKSCSWATDLPDVDTQINLLGYGRTLHHYYGNGCFPESIAVLENEIPGLAGIVDWVGSVHSYSNCDTMEKTD